MKREYCVTVEEYLVERGVRGFVQAVDKFSTEYQTFQRGELEDAVVDAASNCWHFLDREIQLKKPFQMRALGRGKTVMLRESFLDAEKEDILGTALHVWKVKGSFGLIESIIALEVALKRLVFAICVIAGDEDVPDRWKGVRLCDDIEFDCLELFIQGYGAAKKLADAGICGFERIMQVLDALQRHLFVHCAARCPGKAIAYLCTMDIWDDFLLCEDILRATEDMHSIVKSCIALAEEKRHVSYVGSSVMKVFAQVKGRESNDTFESDRKDFPRMCSELSGCISMASPGAVETVLLLGQYAWCDCELLLSYLSLVSQCDRWNLKENLLKRCNKRNIRDVSAKDILDLAWSLSVPRVDDVAVASLIHLFTSTNMIRMISSDERVFQIEWLILYLVLARVMDKAGLWDDAGSSALNPSEGLSSVCVACWRGIFKTLRDDGMMRKMCIDMLHVAEPPQAMAGSLSKFTWCLIKSTIGSALLVVLLGENNVRDDMELTTATLLIQLASEGHAAEAMLLVSNIVDSDMKEESSFRRLFEKLREVCGLCFSVGSGIFQVLEKEILNRLIHISQAVSQADGNVSETCEQEYRYASRMLLLLLSTSDIWSERGDFSASVFRLLAQLVHAIFCFVNVSDSSRDDRISVLMKTLNAYRCMVSKSQRVAAFEMYLRESAHHEVLFVLCLWLLFASTDNQIDIAKGDDGMLTMSEEDMGDVLNGLLLFQERIETIQSPWVMCTVAGIYSTWIRTNDMFASIIDSDLIVGHLERIYDNSSSESSSMENIQRVLKSDCLRTGVRVSDISCLLIPRDRVKLNPLKMFETNMEDGRLFGGTVDVEMPPAVQNVGKGGMHGLLFEFVLDNLKSCEYSLGRWSKRREKDDSMEFSQQLRENRDEDIPEEIGKLQSHLWNLSNDIERKIDDTIVHMRHLVCTKYEPFDEKSVAETSDVLDHGEVLQPQLKHHNFDEKIKGLRDIIIKSTTDALSSKYISNIGMDLYGLEYFCASGAMFSRDQSDYLLEDLVTLLVESILFGRSPILGSGNIMDLLETILKYHSIDMDNSRRSEIVSLAAKSLQGLGRGSPLEPTIGARLLEVVLEPDSMLESDKLDEFRELLYHICHLAGGNFDGNLSVLLTNFDVSRFGMLSAQRALETDMQTVRTMASSSKTTHFLSSVFELAQWCLQYEVTASVGVSILDGILTASMERYLCICLYILSTSQRFTGESGIYIKLKEIAGICQSTNVAVESLRILAITTPLKSTDDSLGILDRLLQSPSFLNTVGNLNQNSVGWTSSLAEGRVTCDLVQLGNSCRADLEDALKNFINAYLESIYASGMEYGAIVEQKLSALFQSLNLPRLVEDCPSWAAPWIWRLYLDTLSLHIRSLDKTYEGIGTDVLQPFWDSIPWQLSSLHLDEQVTSLQDLRSTMCHSVFTLSLLLRSDWTKFLQYVREGNKGKLKSSTIAECGVIIMLLSVAVPDWQLPGWMLDEQAQLDLQFLEKVATLIDWKYVKNLIVSSRHEKPYSWILGPIVSTIASGTQGEVSTRLKRTLSVLSGAASSPQTNSYCFYAVFQTLVDVVGFSLCSVGATSSASILPSKSDRMVVPEDFPLELLEGTMEMEQLKIQETTVHESIEENSVELRACFRLSVSDHADIVHSLVSMVSTLNEESILERHNSIVWEESQFQGSIITWDPATSNFTTIYSESEAAHRAHATTVVEALLLAVGSDPITLMTKDLISFGSKDAPWFTGDRIFAKISRTEESDGKYSLKRMLRGFSHGVAHPTSINEVNDWESLLIYLYKIIEDSCIQHDAQNFVNDLGRAILTGLLLFDSLQKSTHVQVLADGIVRQVMMHANPPPISGSTLGEENDCVCMDAFYPSNMAIDRFLGVAQSSADECPLLCTFLLKQAFKRATTIEKSEWQFAITKILQISRKAKKLTMESMLLWLHILDWLNDPRWRRLPPGSHNDSLNMFLTYLDGVVAHLQGAECSRGRMGTQIVRKVSQNIRHHLTSSKREECNPEESHHKEIHDTHTIMERDGSGSLYEIPLTSSHDMGEDLASGSNSNHRRQKFMKGFKAFGRQVSNIGNKITKTAGSQDKQPSTAQVDANVAAPSSAPESNDDDFDIHSSDVVSIGLAAYAISAYIRTVMEPKLARRTRSADAGSMGHPTIRHIKGTSTLSGSRQMEEEQLQELDTILTARSELDVLSKLKNCPCVAQHAHMTEPFFDRMPQLLNFEVSVDDFKIGLVSSLITDPMINRVYRLVFL